jgi:hypothetical protein
VAAVVGLLAALTSGVGPATAQAVLATAATGASVALQADPPALSAPVTGIVTDGVRAGHPAAVRAAGGDRTAAHTGATAVATLLLLLAACCALLGVRRLATRAPRTAWHAPAAPRAPPASATC